MQCPENCDGDCPEGKCLKCKDSFYGQHEPDRMPVGYELINKWNAYLKLGCKASEMESAALYINAAQAGKKALAICTISDSLVTGDVLPAGERQSGFRNMMELGLSLL